MWFTELEFKKKSFFFGGGAPDGQGAPRRPPRLMPRAGRVCVCVRARVRVCVCMFVVCLWSLCTCVMRMWVSIWLVRNDVTAPPGGVIDSWTGETQRQTTARIQLSVFLVTIRETSSRCIWIKHLIHVSHGCEPNLEGRIRNGLHSRKRRTSFCAPVR